MSRYAIFKNNVINYNIITQYSYTNIKSIPKILKITVSTDDKHIVLKNSWFYLEYLYLIESFTNKIKYNNVKTLQQQQKFSQYSAVIKQKNLLIFLEFLVIFVLPEQDKIKVTFIKMKNSCIIAKFHIKNRINNQITVPSKKFIIIEIKINAHTIKEAKTLLNQLNLPFLISL